MHFYFKILIDSVNIPRVHNLQGRQNTAERQEEQQKGWSVNEQLSYKEVELGYPDRGDKITECHTVEIPMRGNEKIRIPNSYAPKKRSKSEKTGRR